METNDNGGGRCGPLCQHPGCWESDRRNPLQQKHSQHRQYVERLLQGHRLRQEKHQRQERDGTTDTVLTVQRLDLDADNDRQEDNLVMREMPPTVKPLHHSPSMSRQLHKFEVQLEPSSSSSFSSSSLSLEPVLIWRPGTNGVQQQQKEEESPQKTLAVKTLQPNEIIPSINNSTSKDEVKWFTNLSNSKSRPHSRLDSLDFLNDIPHYLVEEIIDQLQSSFSPSPPPNATTTTSRPMVNQPDSCHIPSSIICNLSSGQFHRNTQPVHRTSSQQSEHSPSPPPQPHSQSKVSDVKKTRRRRTVTIPSVPDKTSFSRALSQFPQSVLHKTRGGSVPTKPVTTHTVNYTLSIPHLPPARGYLSSLSSNNRSRYPHGNPIEPRTLQPRYLDPLLTHSSPPLPPPSQTNGRSLGVFPVDIHNTRLVTLHCSSTNIPPQTNSPPITTGTTHTQRFYEVCQ